MRSRTASIDRGVADGEGVGATVAIGVELAATADREGLGFEEDVAPPHAETTTAIAKAARRRITPVYRGGPLLSAPRRSRLVRSSASAACARGLAPAVFFRLLLGVLLAPEDDLAVLRVNEDRVAFLELA